MSSLSLRPWATPLVAASFLLMAVTGTLMFLHAAPGLAREIHEWAGWIFLAGAGAHLALNWRPFAAHLRRPLSQAILGAGVAAVAVSLYPSGETGRPDIQSMINSLSAASLSQLAAIGGQSDAVLAAKLAQAGLAVTSPSQTVAEIAGADTGERMVVLQAALSSSAD